MLGLQLLCSDGKGIAEIVKSDAVEDLPPSACQMEVSLWAWYTMFLYAMRARDLS